MISWDFEKISRFWAKIISGDDLISDWDLRRDLPSWPAWAQASRSELKNELKSWWKPPRKHWWQKSATIGSCKSKCPTACCRDLFKIFLKRAPEMMQNLEILKLTSSSSENHQKWWFLEPKLLYKHWWQKSATIGSCKSKCPTACCRDLIKMSSKMSSKSCQNHESQDVPPDLVKSRFQIWSKMAQNVPEHWHFGTFWHHFWSSFWSSFWAQKITSEIMITKDESFVHHAFI